MLISDVHETANLVLCGASPRAIWVLLQAPESLLYLQHHGYYLPTPPLGQDMTQVQFFKRSLTGLNSEFSFS